ncbi:MAG: hypothetical protein QXN55_00790 [Candidatus Nitrosotenuis sp.]
MLTINDILISPIPEVKDLGERAVTLKKQLDEKQITEDEFTELLEDIKSLNNIHKEMVSLETWRELLKAVQIIDMIRHWAPF